MAKEAYWCNGIPEHLLITPSKMMYICIHVYIFVCEYACMYTGCRGIYIYIYIYTSASRSKWRMYTCGVMITMNLQYWCFQSPSIKRDLGIQVTVTAFNPGPRWKLWTVHWTWWERDRDRESEREREGGRLETSILKISYYNVFNIYTRTHIYIYIVTAMLVLTCQKWRFHTCKAVLVIPNGARYLEISYSWRWCK